MNLFGGGGNNEAARARQQEEERQARIRAGTQHINAIFDGGIAPQLNAPGQGNSRAPFTAGDASTAPGQRVKGQFTDDFFRSIRDGFTNYAMPQLHQQRDDAGREMAFSLDRSGLTNSSVRGQKAGELQRLFDLNEQQIRDQALAYENQSRTGVENARSDLIAMLNATGDAQGAANSALSRAAVLTQPQAYSPLGQLFQDFTAGLGTQAAMERSAAAAGGMYRPRYDTGLFGGTGRVINR